MSTLSPELQQIISQATPAERPSEARQRRMKQQLMMRVATGSALVAVASSQARPEMGGTPPAETIAPQAGTTPTATHHEATGTRAAAHRHAASTSKGGGLSLVHYTLIGALLGAVATSQLVDETPLRVQLSGLPWQLAAAEREAPHPLCAPTTAATQPTAQASAANKQPKRRTPIEIAAAAQPKRRTPTEIAAAAQPKQQTPPDPLHAQRPRREAPPAASHTPSSEVPRPEPAAATRYRESHYIRQARLLAETHPGTALRWLDQHQRHYPQGTLARVRKALRAKIKRMVAKRNAESR